MAPDLTDAQSDAAEEGRPGATSYDIELLFKSVSAAIGAEAATGGLAKGGEAGERGADFEIRIGRALDLDLAAWLGEAKQAGSAHYVPVVRMLKAWNQKSAPSREVLLAHVLDAALDPLTWRTVLENVGPRPAVSVLLSVPGSYAHATTTEPLREIDLAVVYRGTSRAAEEVEDLARAMTPDIPLPTPPVVLQARRNAEARTALLHEFGALTATQVAELAGSEAKNTSALAGRWRREGRLVAIDYHGTTYYPGFQFDTEGKPIAVIATVLEHLSGPRVTPWQQALWFTTANGWLDGRRPIELLDEEPDAIVAAAHEALREPVG